MLSINRLLGEIEDPYMEVYSLMKENLQEGISIKIPVRMSNIDGLRIIPPYGKTYCTATLLIKAMRILYISKKKASRHDNRRFNLIDSQTEVPFSLIFKDDEIAVSIVTKNQTRSFKGIAEYFFEDRELTDLIEVIQFDRDDFFDIDISLEKSGSIRSAFESNYGTQNELIYLKKRVLDSVQLVDTKSISKKNWDLLNSFDVITDPNSSKKELLNQINLWLSFHKNHPELIKSLNSIYHFYNILEINTIDNESVFNDFIAKKLL